MTTCRARQRCSGRWRSRSGAARGRGEPLLGRERPAGAVAALGVFAARRLDAGAALPALIGSADADLSVVGSRGLPLVGAAPDVRVRDAAIETGLFFGLRSALAASRRLAASGEPSTVAFLDELEADPESKRGRT